MILFHRIISEYLRKATGHVFVRFGSSYVLITLNMVYISYLQLEPLFPVRSSNWVNHTFN